AAKVVGQRQIEHARLRVDEGEAVTVARLVGDQLVGDRIIVRIAADQLFLEVWRRGRGAYRDIAGFPRPIRTRAAAGDRIVDAEDDLVDADDAIAIQVNLPARLHRRCAEGNVDAQDDFVDRHHAVAVAIPRTGSRLRPGAADGPRTDAD